MPSSRKETEPDPAETALYIAGMAHELRTLAAKANLGFIAYLLAMVEDDAEASARQRDPPQTAPDT